VKIVHATLAPIALGLLFGTWGAAAHERLGKVNFPNSCNPAVAGNFNTAIALLHSFWAKEAIEGFNLVLKEDPSCAMAYWGIAMASQQNPLTGQEPSPQASQAALAALSKASAAGAKTPRERDYLAAIELIYKDADKVPFRARRQAYEKAMESMTQRYPEDTEAAIFHALSLNMTADLADKTYANQLKAAAILEKLSPQQPEHPGISHYLIHSYDYPAIAEKGVGSASLYAKAAPDNPHALHMPSHIFTRLGSWQASIDSNKRSAAAAKAEFNGQEQAHAMDYLVYAHLQLGQDGEAKRLVAEGLAIDTINPAIFIGPYALAAMPAREALERRAWKDAAALKVQTSRFPFTVAIGHFARGLGLARTGDVDGAQREIAQLAALRDALNEQKNTYWSRQVEVQRLAVAGWTALAQRQQSEALNAMRASADLEDSMEKHIVTPAPMVPARELLGEMLLEMKQPADALQAFESSAQREPNRLRGLYGAAQAAELAGNREKARAYYAKLAALTEKGDGNRPELRRAKAFLAQR
jgi:hypothetical protein